MAEMLGNQWCAMRFAHLLGYFINFFLLFGLVDHFGYPHELVQGAAIVYRGSISFCCL